MTKRRYAPTIQELAEVEPIPFVDTVTEEFVGVLPEDKLEQLKARVKATHERQDAERIERAKKHIAYVKTHGVTDHAKAYWHTTKRG